MQSFSHIKNIFILKSSINTFNEVDILCHYYFLMLKIVMEKHSVKIHKVFEV